MGKGSAVVMVQGTTSHAGKSVLASALCRIFARDGLTVAPFKAQNMSLNSYATPDGDEIGRAQALQAEAAMIPPSVDMNPILLKPEAERRSQVVVMGRPTGSVSARDYYTMKAKLWPVVTDALGRLRNRYDVVVIEGAGSPAEINLRDHEIVNMRVALHAEAPVLLIADIDRGGVFASLVGTMELLEPEERALVQGFVINKFRGDPELLEPGIRALDERTNVRTLGVLPYFTDILIPEEDSLGLRASAVSETNAVIDVAVIRLPHIANFDDFDPLVREPGVGVRYVSGLNELGDPDLIVLPGSKTTMEDLAWLKQAGLAQAIVARRSSGTPVAGICAGFQMLGQRLLDPDGVESGQRETEALGLLPVTTVFEATKGTEQTQMKAVSDRGLLEGCGETTLKGYEIHMGRTQAAASGSPFHVTSRSGRAVDDRDGAFDDEGKVLGTYMHGLFHNDALRHGMLRRIAAWKGVTLPPGAASTDTGAELDKLAAFVRRHLDMAAVYRIAGIEEGRP